MQSVELLARMHQDNEREYKELFRRNEERIALNEERIAHVEDLITRIVDVQETLARVVSNHNGRIGRLEGQ